MLPYANLQNDIPVLLAPMSGVTDAPFRKQAIRFGAKVAITEMVAGEELTQGHKEAETRLTRPTALNGCHVVQLVGRTADPLRRAAHIASESGADVIDINMGCPSRRVTGGLSGSALMRDLDRSPIGYGSPMSCQSPLHHSRSNLYRAGSRPRFPAKSRVPSEVG